MADKKTEMKEGKMFVITFENNSSPVIVEKDDDINDILNELEGDDYNIKEDIRIFAVEKEFAIQTTFTLVAVK